MGRDFMLKTEFDLRLINRPESARKVSVAVMHPTRDRRVSSSMRTCGCTSSCAHICIKKKLCLVSCHSCMLRPVLKKRPESYGCFSN